MTNTLLKVAKALTDAVYVTLQRGRCDVSRGVEHLHKTLGDNALFHVDGQVTKENNLLVHFKRLTTKRLISRGMDKKEVERHLKKFKSLEKRYNEDVRRAREIYAKEKECLALLQETVDCEGSTMEKWHKTFKDERVGTISQLKRLGLAEFRLMGVPIGDAMIMMDTAKDAEESAVAFEHLGGDDVDDDFEEAVVKANNGGCLS